MIVTKCDFCSRPHQYYTTQQLSLYCDSKSCVEKADKILWDWNIECERAQTEYYKERDSDNGT